MENYFYIKSEVLHERYMLQVGNVLITLCLLAEFEYFEDVGVDVVEFVEFVASVELGK